MSQPTFKELEHDGWTARAHAYDDGLATVLAARLRSRRDTLLDLDRCASTTLPVHWFVCFLQVPPRKTPGSKVAMSHVVSLVAKARWIGNVAGHSLEDFGCRV
jgi:hypothetical protein